jgi:hypothetical protein
MPSDPPPEVLDYLARAEREGDQLLDLYADHCDEPWHGHLGEAVVELRLAQGRPRLALG